MSSRIRIGRARQVEHFLAIEDLQKEVWEFSDREIIPRNELITIQRNGGVVLCAWDGPEMVGFVFGFVGLDGRRLQHASRMLAVRASHRVHGIGRRLKAAQRRAVLAQGISLMTWTFDPLQSRNAHLNIAVLGGTAHEYLVDVYGPSTSVLNRGVPTDRLLLRWDLKSPRGRALSPDEAAGRRTVAIPRDVNALREADPGRVLVERLRVRRELQRAFRSGWGIVGFSSDGASESRYVLGRRRG
ncbi:MAG: GNAT family N-acetyltransferase [Candidatus Brocadiae bacterium]|nr:GNAT family N-acetyltransferase [Candidatus Brocadiia bacterium]